MSPSPGGGDAHTAGFRSRLFGVHTGGAFRCERAPGSPSRGGSPSPLPASEHSCGSDLGPGPSEPRSWGAWPGGVGRAGAVSQVRVVFLLGPAEVNGHVSWARCAACRRSTGAVATRWPVRNDREDAGCWPSGFGARVPGRSVVQ